MGRLSRTPAHTYAIDLYTGSTRTEVHDLTADSDGDAVEIARDMLHDSTHTAAEVLRRDASGSGYSHVDRLVVS
ncbi:hypothetical protein [Verrucosispora sp. NA02020]|uniref:hypothetical protein n=1 Tax=Verrucosispora sp. NA02020 TaxID=2742132 RepID=UPI0015908EB0|nr:hypothetical protein [Verrucosispora sp. NA02020]QKW15445.1 hypothetical protein HUT12_23535 [Verrucosispora sp. NA02020]